MSPNSVFWTAALGWMALMVGVAAWGWRAIRHRDLVTHRRAMNAACWMLGGFLVAYVVKVFLLGREDLGSWATGQVTLLRIHESLVAVMILSGARARWLARRMRAGFGADPQDRRRHRLAGRTSIVAGLLALATAGFVLVGMLS